MADGVNVTELYGIGKRYDVGCSGGQRVVVVVRKDGARELYAFEAGAAEDEPTAVIRLGEEEARVVGAVLSGTYFGGSG